MSLRLDRMRCLYCAGVILLAAWQALGNPTVPQFGGTWNASADAGSDYTTQTTILKINTGVTVNVLTGTAISVTGAHNWYDNTGQIGTLNNYGTLDLSAFGTANRFVQAGTPTINNLGTMKFGDLTDPRCYGAFVLYNGGTIAKTAGTGSTSLFSWNGTSGTMNNYYVDGSGVTNGGAGP